MSFSASVFRASLRNATVVPLRRTATQAPTNCNKILFRNSFNRKYSTTPPPSPQAKPGPGPGLYVAVGAAVVGFGLAVYYFDTITGKEAGTAVKSGIQAAKVKVNFVPKKEDYIKVRFKCHSFLFKALFLISCWIGCRCTTKLSMSLTKLANMMVHFHCHTCPILNLRAYFKSTSRWLLRARYPPSCLACFWNIR